MPITFKRAGQEAVTLENVSFNGVALDKVTFKRAGQEAVTVFEKAAADALAGTWVFKDTLEFDVLGISQEETIDFRFNFISDNSEMKALIVNSGLTQEGKTLYEVIYEVSPEGGSIGEPIAVYYSADFPGSGVIKGWTSSSYKTINITSKLSEVTNGEQLLAWLQANATKQT